MTIMERASYIALYPGKHEKNYQIINLVTSEMRVNDKKYSDTFIPIVNSKRPSVNWNSKNEYNGITLQAIEPDLLEHNNVNAFRSFFQSCFICIMFIYCNLQYENI
jgi:hypothetical protein